jgi:Sugar-transfer associated ATP-grasp
VKHRSLRERIKNLSLRLAEDFAYDLVGLPVAIKQLPARPLPSPVDAPGAYLRAFYGTQFWRRGIWTPIRAALAVVVWPFAFAFSAAQLTLRNGKLVRELTGKTEMRQLAEQITMAVGQSVVPYWYYMFEIYEEHRRAVAGLYLQRYETKGPIYGLLQPQSSDGMQDKAVFSKRCREAHVAAVPVLLELTRGSVRAPDGNFLGLPRKDLFVKPRIGRGGRHAERWDCTGDGKWKNVDGKILDESSLLKHLVRLSLKRDYVVQPRLTNHPDLAPVNNGALATVRIITCINEIGEPEAMVAAFRMAKATNHIVDNFHAGGIAAAVDLASGRLGSASNMGLKPDVGWCKVHPDSGAPIEGRVLPFWPLVIELSCRAHRAFPKRVIVGWDIGILGSGPIIIEGNIRPDLDIHQRVARAPLGNERLARLLAFNVDKILSSCGKNLMAEVGCGQ